MALHHDFSRPKLTTNFKISILEWKNYLVIYKNKKNICLHFYRITMVEILNLDCIECFWQATSVPVTFQFVLKWKVNKVENHMIQTTR